MSAQRCACGRLLHSFPEIASLICNRCSAESKGETVSGVAMMKLDRLEKSLAELQGRVRELEGQYEPHISRHQKQLILAEAELFQAASTAHAAHDRLHVTFSSTFEAGAGETAWIKESAELVDKILDLAKRVQEKNNQLVKD